VPMLCRKGTSSTTRTTRAKGRLKWSIRLLGLPILRRRTRKNAMCVVVSITRRQTTKTARISNCMCRRSLLMLLFVTMRREQLGMEIMPLFYQFVIYQIGGLTLGRMYMCVLMLPCFLLRANVHVCANASLFSSY
jgi:hypothetical protein